MTPEGKVKAQVNKLLSKYPNIYVFKPVPFGWGPSSLDYILCVAGVFVGIETKALNKEPTARQLETIRRIREAGGKVFVAREAKDLTSLERYLDTLKQFDHLVK